MRPVEHPPPHAHVADHHRPAGVADVKLQPAERLEIERLETVDPLAADEPRPVEEVVSSHAGPAGSCASWHISSTIVPSGASIVKCGQPTICSWNSKVTNCPCGCGLPAGNRQAASPAGAATGSRRMRKRVGHAELEPIGRIAEPIDAARLGQPHGRHLALAQRRDLPHPQRASFRVGTFQQVAARVVAARGRLVGRAVQHHGRRPPPVGLERRRVPARRVQPGVELLLQRAEIPALELSRPVCPIDRHLPRRVGDDLLAAAVGPFDREVEDQPRLAGRPGAVADARSTAPRRRSRSCPRVRRAVRSTGSTSRLRGSQGAGPHWTRRPLTVSR